MTLRTPRRRISPQTKRRYRAIKGFFRRALGSTSQPDLQITSSIAVNVTDIKHKIGLEQRLHDANKHCRDINVDEVSERESQTATETDWRDETRPSDIPSRTKLNGVETKILYKTSESHYKKSDESEYGKAKNDANVNFNKDMSDFYDGQFTKKKNEKSKYNNGQSNIDSYYRKHKTKSVYESFVSELSASSFHSLNEFKEMTYPNPGDTVYGEEKKNRTKGRSDQHKDKLYKEHLKTPDQDTRGLRDEIEQQAKKHKQKPSSKELDHDFIADIIRRQYKPVKIGRKVSDLSQFSTPECRDKGFGIDVDQSMQQTKADRKQFSGYYERRDYIKQVNHSDHTDMRSVCDARLYNFKRNPRIKQRRRLVSNYNDSEIYDLVPVKEKSSPKSRRKFFEDNMASTTLYNKELEYKEVPPSPRTHRPKLNLKVQYYTGFEEEVDDNNMKADRRISPKRLLQKQDNDDDEIDYITCPRRRSSPKRTVQLQDTDVEMDYMPHPRRASPNRQVQHMNNDEIDYMTQPYKRISPRGARQQYHNDEKIDFIARPTRRNSPKGQLQELENYDQIDYIPRPSRRTSPKRPVQQHENMNEIDYMARTSRRTSSKRPTQQHDNEGEIDYMTRPSRRTSPERPTQKHDNEDDVDYMPRPSRRTSPKRPVPQHDNENETDFLTRPGRKTSPKRPIQQYENKDDIDFRRCSSRRTSPKRVMDRDEETDEFVDQHDIRQNRTNENLSNAANKPNEMGTMCSYQCSTIDPDENEVALETSLNKTEETMLSVDKTDKALCEIKDILQNFLQEIKKEATSPSDKSVISTKMTENGTSIHPNLGGLPNSLNSLNDYNTTQCPMTPTPFMPNFATTNCCYPLMPICPMNCMQNGFPAPSTSFTCTHCVNNNSKPNETTCDENILKNDSANEAFQTETNELIKEIYKFVSQSPTFCRKQENPNEKLYSPRKDCNSLKPQVTSRGAGGSTEICRFNVKVGTPKTNSVSKSCEAIITPKLSEAYTNETNASYSDTILEKVSLEATGSESISNTDLSQESEVEKAKKNKFARVMKSFSIFKKKKKDVIEELSNSEEEEEEVKKPPFQQDIVNYMMHDQEYFIPPPISHNYRPDYPQNYGPPYNSGGPEYPMPLSPHNLSPHTFRNPRIPQHTEPGSPYSHYPGHSPTAPPISSSYDTYSHMQPQVPLCLKEIEVKSIGCQSERKLSFFRKIGIKNQKPAEITRFESIQKTCSTQTAQNNQNKPGLFNWGGMQSKSMGHNDPLSFSYKTQKKLAEGDIKMRDAMLKKMFYKKNPFSPNNLIIKTLLGKDKSSYGDPPSMYRPRMFL